METISLILSHIQNYVGSLDWAYIFTFITICYGLNHYQVKSGLGKLTRKTVRTRYRVILVGLLYAVALYFLRGYSPDKIESLFQSFVFAIVFHKLIVEAFLYWLAKHVLPESISKHFLSGDELANLQWEGAEKIDRLNEPGA